MSVSSLTVCSSSSAFSILACSTPVISLFQGIIMFVIRLFIPLRRSLLRVGCGQVTDYGPDIFVGEGGAVAFHPQHGSLPFGPGLALRLRSSDAVAGAAFLLEQLRSSFSAVIPLSARPRRTTKTTMAGRIICILFMMTSSASIFTYCNPCAFP